jgi:hypothetical protein
MHRVSFAPLILTHDLKLRKYRVLNLNLLRIDGHL